jgi:hypothetical protein
LPASTIYIFTTSASGGGANTIDLIIVKEPESDQAKIISIPVNIETTTSNPRPEELKLLENLDEVNRFHRRQR